MRPPLPPGPYLVVGLARSGVAATRLLASRGEVVAGCDSGSPAEAAEVAAEFSGGGIDIELESDGLELLKKLKPAVVIKSPGVPQEADVITEARVQGLTVMGELELAWRLIEVPFCAVTGTNGKTTTVEMIGSILSAAGKPVVLGGNIGSPLTALVGEIGPDGVVVAETSSFQIEDTLEFTPDVAVLLNLSEDHLDRHGSLDCYLAAKLRLFSNQSGSDYAVLNADQSVLTDNPNSLGEARQLWFGSQVACDSRGGCELYADGGDVYLQGQLLYTLSDLNVRGRHNLENSMAAAGAALALGVDRDSIAKGLSAFKAVPHRMEEVGVYGGVTYINDSKATNVDATLAALTAFNGGVHLILGGTLKGGGFAPLRESVKAKCSACYLIGEAAPSIAEDLANTGVELIDCGDLATAVKSIAERSAEGEAGLLSPACASFDQFANFEERGELFRTLVERELG